MEIEKIKHGSDINGKPRFILNSVVNSDGVEEVQFVNPKKVLNKVLEAVKDDKAAKKAEADKFIKGLPKFINEYEPQTEFGKAIKNSFGNKYLNKHASSVYVLSGTDLTAFELVRKRILSKDSHSNERAVSEYIDDINDIKRFSDSSFDSDKFTLGEEGLIYYNKVKTNSNGVRKYYEDDSLVKSVYPDGSVHFKYKSYDVNEDSYSVTKYSPSGDSEVDTYFSDGLHIESKVSEGVVTNKVSLRHSGSSTYYSQSRDGKLISEKFNVNDDFAVHVDLNADSKLTNERVSLKTGRYYTDSSGDSGYVEMAGSNYQMDASGNINVYKSSPNGRDYLAYSFTQNDTSSKIWEYNSHGDVVNTYTSSLDETTYISDWS